jgi:hypothetical protein
VSTHLITFYADCTHIEDFHVKIQEVINLFSCEQKNFISP